MTREEAIEILSLRKYCNEEIAKALDMAIEALSADVVQGWIPVSERLPSEKEYVLASVTAPDRIHDIIIIKGIDVECYSKWVSAWQPLPTPYKESEVEE